MPRFLAVREARVYIKQPGFRTKAITIVTTLLDPIQYTKEDLADLYRQRWNNELDLRSIKCTMRMEVYARVAPKLKAKIENLFARAVLDTDLGTWNPDAAYELNQLKDRTFELATDAEDRIRVYIRKARLSFKNSGRRIWLEVEDDHDNIHDMIDECLNRENVSMDEVNLTLVTFTFQFLPLEYLQTARWTKTSAQAFQGGTRSTRRS